MTSTVSQSRSDPFAFPIETPPPGVQPNFINPQSNAYQMTITCGVCIGLIMIFYLVRLSAIYRNIYKKGSWWREALLAIAVASTVAQIAMTISVYSHRHMFGVHEWNILLSFYEDKTPLVLILITTYIYLINIFWIKLCLIQLYLDIFLRLRWFRLTCYILLFTLGAFTISFTAILIARCTPIHNHTWLGYLEALEGPKCSHSQNLNLIVGSFNLITDVILLVLPLPAIWTLNMPTKKKLGVSIMFLTGSCAVATSAMGIYYREVTLHHQDDLTWYVARSQAVSVSEMTAGLMVICMPAVAAMLRRTESLALVRSLFWTSFTSRSRSHGPAEVTTTSSQAPTDNGTQHHSIYYQPRKGLSDDDTDHLSHKVMQHNSSIMELTTTTASQDFDEQRDDSPRRPIGFAISERTNGAHRSPSPGQLFDSTIWKSTSYTVEYSKV